MIYINLQMPRAGSGSTPDPMLQILQMLTSDREAERAERQANLATLQQIAQLAHNNQGHGNQDNHGSKLKNFQNTNPSPGLAPRTNRPPMTRPNYPNRGNPRPGGNHNNPGNSIPFNRAPPKFNTNHATINPNTAPRTGSNAVPVAAKDKSQVTCYDCGNKGHYSNEYPNKKNTTAPNTNVPAQ